MNRQKVQSLFSKLREANPSPKTELEHSSVFELLVAVVLSAQATDKGVNLATRKLFAVANTPQAIVALGEERLMDYVKTIGLYRTKSKNVLALCQLLIERFAGEVPQTREELESLPGVGRKTANVILNTAFGQPTMAVDTHIYRLGNRTKLAPGKTVLEVEKKLLKVIPKEFILDAHHWLILHGRYVCKARKPECERCIIQEECEYAAKGFVSAAS